MHSLELSVGVYWAGNNDIREREEKREDGSWGREVTGKSEQKSCNPAGSLGTNGNRFIKPHPTLSSSFALCATTLTKG